MSPRATVNLQQEKQFDLKSCPGGFIILRKMNYGQFLHRRDIAAKITMQMDESEEVLTSLMQKAVSRFEFSVCIVDHNLEDESERKLDFQKGNDFDNLDPIIGQEIDSYINDMNQGGFEKNLFTESEQA